MRAARKKKKKKNRKCKTQTWIQTHTNSLNYDHVHISPSLPLLQEWKNMDSGCDGWMKFHRSLIVAHVACGGFLG